MSNPSEEKNERPSTVTAKRNGIAVEALLYTGDKVSVNRGQDGTVYARIGFGVEMKLLPKLAAELKAAL